MEYQVKRITSKEEIISCNEIHVDHYLWTCKQHPKTVGRMGFIEDKGLYFHMTCYEENPLRNYQKDMDPVCEDSAMEAFLAFPHTEKDDKNNFIPYNSCLYMNFEMNSNGAMHAKYGWGRKGRTALTKEELRQCECRANIKNGYWTVSFVLNKDLIEKVYGIKELENIDSFWCNFYKISENKNIEHYVAYSPIISEKPNFHLPQFFAKAVLL